ncbi:50S ribosomal protein L31 [Gibbsiella dentisursi]
MKQGIHPKYEEVTANCSCGNVIKIRSTVGHDLNLRFNKRFSVPGAKK